MTLNSTSNEKIILYELSQGSEVAFTKLYNQYKNNVYAVALKITKSKILAEETVQNVFLKIWQNHHSLAEIESIENYLFIIARNQIFDMLKKTARDTASLTAVNSDNTFSVEADSSVQDDQYSHILNRIVEQLPPQQKKIYKMARQEGLSHQEIAENLGLATDTVKKHMAQALKFIRQKIAPYMHIFMYLVFYKNL
nr:RNA polymerase sigma-70 factor [uncultured Flavobacterium sp.]